MFVIELYNRRNKKWENPDVAQRRFATEDEAFEQVKSSYPEHMMSGGIRVRPEASQSKSL